tara:strand:- start:847 stop:1029 length:183 start_codon:yes stop_codon:yes gene_type:complete
MVELVKNSVAADLLEARTVGALSLSDEQFKLLSQIVNRSLTTMADRTYTRVSNEIQNNTE